MLCLTNFFLFSWPFPPCFACCSPRCSCVSSSQFLRLAGWVNLLPHTAHWKGFFPVCTTTWCSSACLVVNFF